MSFRVGLSREMLRADGAPSFGAAALSEFEANSDIVWEWLPDVVRDITPEIAARYDGLVVNTPRVTTACLSPDMRLKIVARFGVGFDTVDVPGLSAAGVAVTNTPIAVRRPVAVAALTHVFALAGRMVEKDALVRAGRFSQAVDFMGFGLSRRTLGVVGCGGIGAELIRLAHPFFGEVLGADPFVEADAVRGMGGRKVSFEALLAESDVVVAACPLTDQTRRLFNAATFAAMRPGSFFVNVARGPVHDEAALIAALNDGRLAGAGLDVTEVEPTPADAPILSAPNVILTSHALCWTDECFDAIARSAFASVVDLSLGQRPRHLVDPQVRLRGEPPRGK